ncbi:MAG: helix-turn-helix domain-containing protein [Amaricoccus sp.]
MIRSVPLIRAGSLVPFVKWLRANGRPLEGRLRTARLAAVAFDDPDQLIPLVSGFAFLGELAAQEGMPDLGCRVVGTSSLRDLGELGHVALSGRTPRDGLRRAASAMTYYSTHERMSFIDRPGGGEARFFFAIKGHAEALHVAQHYTAALVQLLCRATGIGGPVLERVELVPHPTEGVGHLVPWLGEGVAAAPDRVLRVRIPEAVLAAPLRLPADAGRLEPAPLPLPINRNAGFAPTARILVELMLDDGVPTIEQLAEASGMSVRTLQRRLGEEEVSFTAILDAARRDRATAALVGGSVPVGELAVHLGYSGPACLTRAVRRWTAATPSQLRQGGRGA